MNTCSSTTDAQSATGPHDAGAGGWSCIIWWAGRAARICLTVATGCAFVGDAITRFTIKGFPGMATLQRARSSRRRLKRTAPSTSTDSRN